MSDLTRSTQTAVLYQATTLYPTKGGGQEGSPCGPKTTSFSDAKNDARREMRKLARSPGQAYTVVVCYPPIGMPEQIWPK